MGEQIWLVHNGIIENYQALKEGLIAQGLRFSSDTDTEVIAKLIGSLYQGDLRAAVLSALSLVEGAYGIAVMSERSPDQIVAARQGSPLVLGLGTGAHFVASDAAPLLPYTKDVIYLNDGDVAVISKDSYAITSRVGQVSARVPERIEWSVETLQKDGYAHFMEKEIFEAPQVVENTIRGRLLPERGRAKLGGLEAHLPHLASLERLLIVGCGSAYYAGQVGRTMIEEYVGLPVEVELGSEFRYKRLFAGDKTAVLAISQSGETADTLTSIRRAKEVGLATFGIVNVVGSTIARETDAGVYNHAGPEVAVASTKAFISQLTALALLTLAIGRERGLSLAEGQAIAQGLRELPAALRTVLDRASEMKAIAAKYADSRDAMFIGRKLHAPIAYEGALKLKEVSYIHAEAYAGGELKHGSIALLDPSFPVIALAPRDEVYEKMISNIEEVRARQAPVFAIGTTGDYDLARVANDVFLVPSVHPLLQPIVTVLPLQLFAYYVGLARGLNVDRPRNLAKSVTVE
jgi:glucosamine--fructose-6-phosphate aminotransferase (isomerizing)